MNRHRYGWKPQRPDHRDMIWNPFARQVVLPPVVDLRLSPFMPPVYDQGQLGSCTANAIASAYEFQHRKQGLPDFMPSRLFIYYNERDMEGTIAEDGGAVIRDGFKSISKQGVCPEMDWPYDVSQFAVKPAPTCYRDAMQDQATAYLAVGENSRAMMGCLAQGYPIVGGLTLYESFESNEVGKTGFVPLPGPDESVIGGHAIKYVGYNLAGQYFIVKNSWGTGWGDGGFFKLPFDYIDKLHLGSDHWTLRTVE